MRTPVTPPGPLVLSHVRMLGNLSLWLAKAEAQAEVANASARLESDMFALATQNCFD